MAVPIATMDGKVLEGNPVYKIQIASGFAII